MRAGARPDDRIALTALLAFVAARCLVPMDETDLFFNLRLGELILETGSVPTTNVLSFTYPDARDVNLAWLFQVLLALVHRVAGVPGTVLLKTAFAVGTVAILYRVARRRGAPPAMAALALALAAWAAEPRFVERPHLVTFIGLAVLLLALERAEAGRPRLLWGMIPAGLVWANANSCFFLAPLVLGIYARGAWLDGKRADAKRALIVGGAMLPLAFATPSGAGWLPYVANHFLMPWVRPLQEYRHAEWPLDGPFFFVAAGLAVLAALPRLFGPLRQALGGQRLLPLRHAFPLLLLGALGAIRIRFVAEFALLAGPALAAGFTALLRTLFGDTDRPRLGRSSAVTAAAVLGVLALLPRITRAQPWMTLGIEPGLIPHGAIAFVERHGLDARMYNDLEVGSYLTWRWWPKRRVFQDPRINGYPSQLHAILRRSDLRRDEWEALLGRFGVTSALITFPDVNPRAALFDPERWALVYRGGDGLVFTLRRPEWQAFIAARELPLTYQRRADGVIQPLPLGDPPSASALPLCEWRRRLGDHLVTAGEDPGARDAYASALEDPRCLPEADRAAARRALGAVQLRLQDPTGALAALYGLDDDQSRVNRAYALLALARGAEALPVFDEVLRRTPDNAEAQFGRALALEATGDRAGAAAALEAFRARFPRHLAANAAAEKLQRWGRTPR